MTGKDDTERPTDRIDRRGASRKGSVPFSHPAPGRTPVLDQLDDDVVDWLENDAGPATAQDTAASIIEMERLRRERWHTWRFLMNWTAKGKGSENRIRLIRLLAERRLGVTYDDITDRLDVSRRRAREYVKELRDGNIVESEGRPAQIRFVDDDVFLMATDLAVWY